MKLIALIGLLTPLSLLASGLPILDIQKLDGQYSQGRGEATATYWELPESNGVSNAVFQVLKEQDTFVFSGDAGEYTLENLPEIILKMNNLNWQNANLKTTAQSVNLSLADLTGSSSTQSVRMNNLGLSCQGSSSATLGDAIIENCLKKGNVSLKLVELTDTSRSISWLRIFLRGILTNEMASKTEIENLTMSISNGSFDAKLRASVNIKAEGKIELLESTSSKEVRIRVDKVKASFLNITKKVFETIEDNPIDGVRVERPYIFVELDS